MFEYLKFAQEIILALGVLAGAVWLVLRVFRAPDTLDNLNKKVDALFKDHEARLRVLETEQQLTKIYFVGFKDDLREVKTDVKNIQEILLKGVTRYEENIR